MYTRLYLNRTKHNYRKILQEAIVETEKNVVDFPSISMYKSIYDQLIDIQQSIVMDNIVFSENELYKRYSIGAIAAKNFDLENEVYPQKLSDIFGGSFDYFSMPDGDPDTENNHQIPPKPSKGWSVFDGIDDSKD